MGFPLKNLGYFCDPPPNTSSADAIDVETEVSTTSVAMEPDAGPTISVRNANLSLVLLR